MVDTGPLVDLTVPADRNHAAGLALHRVRRGEFLVPATVVAETSYMIEQRLGGGAEETHRPARRSSRRVTPCSFGLGVLAMYRFMNLVLPQILRHAVVHGE